MLNNKDADPISHFTDLAAVAKSISELEYFFVTTSGSNVYGDINNGKTDFFTETEFN
ncbi:hypothetical protein [Pedobacter jejuensis]|uniref:hypothetical protein n=1 Tax=Pedobacter jejuensis TaxID=1268550 RepID=UPI00142DC666|nr:hypothetical protein [Pedobacter jejuensis]